MASIPDVKAVAYDVCGIVRMEDAGFRAKVGSSAPAFSSMPADCCWSILALVNRSN